MPPKTASNSIRTLEVEAFDTFSVYVPFAVVCVLPTTTPVESKARTVTF